MCGCDVVQVWPQSIYSSCCGALHLGTAFILKSRWFSLLTLGGKPLDGSPEVWRSARREASTRNEGALFSYWAQPSAAWHPSARCYCQLLERQRVVHIKGTFHQILQAKTPTETTFPLHVCQMLIKLWNSLGEEFFKWIGPNLSLATKRLKDGM